MNSDFSEKLSRLRKGKGVSQRKAAASFGISQALLSHYENNIREPGLDFLMSVCDYYDVSADYILGRNDDANKDDSLSMEEESILGELGEDEINALYSVMLLLKAANMHEDGRVLRDTLCSIEIFVHKLMQYVNSSSNMVDDAYICDAGLKMAEGNLYKTVRDISTEETLKSVDTIREEYPEIYRKYEKLEMKVKDRLK